MGIVVVVNEATKQPNWTRFKTCVLGNIPDPRCVVLQKLQTEIVGSLRSVSKSRKKFWACS